STKTVFRQLFVWYHQSLMYFCNALPKGMFFIGRCRVEYSVIRPFFVCPGLSFDFVPFKGIIYNKRKQGNGGQETSSHAMYVGHVTHYRGEYCTAAHRHHQKRSTWFGVDP